MARARQDNVVDREFLPHLDALFHFGLYLTRDRQTAEELTQETMLKAIRSADTYEPGTNAKAWLFRIMSNTRLNQQRRKVFEVELNDRVANQPEDSAADVSAFVELNKSAEESFVNQFSKTVVREAIERLPEDFRTVVVLADLDEFAYKEIAEIIGCPIGTVMSRLFRGRRLLRKYLMSYAVEMGLVDPFAEGKAESEQEESLENVTPLSSYRKSRTSEMAVRGGRDEV